MKDGVVLPKISSENISDPGGGVKGSDFKYEGGITKRDVATLLAMHAYIALYPKEPDAIAKYTEECVDRIMGEEK